ncbi:anti-sigma factor [Actinomycetospora lutea]|uniref:anti-sigma factor domain-containing protein n=1 Tax=Actinomycetospora lutea TaxID=663604 RepID=UPI0023667024|nr:anti-sigma factor [Actinomycetospora lutea]MDD7942384.1 anti-sigma factor [Actinomycetospora lutea]
MHPTDDQLTAAALPGTPVDADVAAHLAACPDCAAEVEALRRTTAHARDAMTLDAAPPPPPELWDGILSRLGDDAPDTGAAGHPTRGRNGHHGARTGGGTPDDRPAPPPARPGRWFGRPVAVLAAVAAVAAAIALVAAVVTGPSGPGSTPPPERITLVATRAGVTGEVVGGPGSMHVEVTLPQPAPAGAALEVWDTGAGAPRSLGVLRPTSAGTHWVGDLPAPSAGGMPPLDVSLQPAGSGPGHSGQSLAHTP